MSYYALKDTDWPWDDEDEGRAIVVQADTPEEAVKVATAMHIAEYPGAGGVTWDVSRLNRVAFGGAVWEDDNKPRFEELTYYSDGINGPPDAPPVSMVDGTLGDTQAGIAGNVTEAKIVGWIYEDELPSGYPYDAMFPYSKVDGVRLFPVFAPSAAQPAQPVQEPVAVVKRYHWSNDRVGMMEHPEGGFVRYSDYRSTFVNAQAGKVEE